MNIENNIELGLLKKVLKKRYEESIKNNPNLTKLSQLDQEVYIQASIASYIKDNYTRQEEMKLEIPKFLKDRTKESVSIKIK